MESYCHCVFYFVDFVIAGAVAVYKVIGIGMSLNESIEFLPNTSSITIRRLKSLGIHTYWDLINFFPYRYEDYSLISKIGRLQEGEVATVIGKIIESKYEVTRTGLRIQKFVISDETGIMELNWYNQPYLLTLLKKGSMISAAGRVKRFGRKTIMNPSEYEIIYSANHKDFKHTGKIIPLYSEKKGLSSRTIREKIWTVLRFLAVSEASLNEYLPNEVISRNNFVSEVTAYEEIHFPSSFYEATKARERLSFDELFIMQLSSKLIRNEWEKEIAGNSFKIGKDVSSRLDQFIQKLPFSLTNAQMRVIDEVKKDLERKRPMNRFLQGEVGSGKTIVAVAACYLSFLNGYQSLFMAPTEILAEQHYQTITNLFHNCQITNHESRITNKSQILNNKYPNISFITGAKKPSKEELGEADIIIGTHALIQKKISFNKVGLVVIDEQHRFGVAQRAELKSKGVSPHLLTMTATPIPRTVMLTLYGELDISVLDEVPKERIPIKTFFIPEQKRAECYGWIKKQIKKYRDQAYIICSLIEESQIETLRSIKAAKKEYERLKKEIFNDYRVGLLHGKLRSKEKSQMMNDFKEQLYDILVATPVVEVGIDIPNARVMIIEGAERFGLAQLHQLRGRIGRGEKQSYCFVFSEKESSEITKRLRFFARTKNGNVLAEKDLEIRGPGNLYGVQQHGYLDLKIASLTDYLLIEKARKEVEYFMEHYELKDYPDLEKRVAELKVGQIVKN